MSVSQPEQRAHAPCRGDTERRDESKADEMIGG